MPGRSRARESTGVARVPPARDRPLHPALRLLPSGRSLVLGAGLLAAGLGAYLLARETSLFAVRTIEVRGARPALAARVRAELDPLVGVGLLRVDGGEVARRLHALPEVAEVSYDRAFPHTLRVTLRTEHPAAILRQGASAWLVSARGRVIRPLSHPERSSLPRVWVPRSAAVSVGAVLAAEEGGRGVRALAALRSERFPTPARSARSSPTELTFVLRSRTEIRLGDESDLRLKLAVARRILGFAGTRFGRLSYVDVSVPERPVAASTNPQVES